MATKPLMLGSYASINQMITILLLNVSFPEIDSIVLPLFSIFLDNLHNSWIGFFLSLLFRCIDLLMIPTLWEAHAIRSVVHFAFAFWFNQVGRPYMSDIIFQKGHSFNSIYWYFHYEYRLNFYLMVLLAFLDKLRFRSARGFFFRDPNQLERGHK